MKSLIAATAFFLVASNALAGSVAPPLMDPQVIAQDSSTSGNVLIEVIGLLIIWAAATTSPGV